jgi:Kdo2-lipid IVA lauroyltransferase/acyltransferase
MLRKVAAPLMFVADVLLGMLVLVIASPLWFLPWRAAVLAGRCAGAIGSLFWAEARRAGMMNLKRAYPEISRGEAAWAVRRVFMNMGASIAEGVQFSRRGAAAAPHVHEDPAIVQRLIDDPRPKIFVTAHLGSWEVALMLARSFIGGRGAVIARAVDNQFLNAVVRKIRFTRASEWIEKRGAIAEAVARLERGESVAMLLDENGGPRGPFIDFFGRRASTRKTPALLSLMTAAPVVVGVALRREEQPFFVRLAIIDEPRDGDDGASIVRITTVINHTFEQWIRDDREQWRWIHWRWRSRPDGSSESYRAADVRACFAAEEAHEAAEMRSVQ